MPRRVGHWTRDKLQILERYLPAYLAATTKAIDRIYIDGFAGPGTNILADGTMIDGSPLIALKARSRNGSAFTRLFFIEQDANAVSELRETIAAQGLAERAELIHGDVNEQLPRIVRSLNRRAPIFVLLDAAGIDPQWKTIQAIAPWQTELLITYPFGMAINRNLKSPKVTAYFGTDESQEILSSGTRRRSFALLNLYKRRLVEVGYTHTLRDDRVVRTSGNAKLYYLIFASKVDIGERIMQAVFDQPDYRGQTRMSLD